MHDILVEYLHWNIDKCACLHRDVMGGVSALATRSSRGLPTLPTQEKGP